MVAALRRPRRGAAVSPKPPAPAYPEPRYTAAVVQLEGVHEDGIPALVHLLRLNRVEPTLYLNARIRQNRPGVRYRFPELKHVTRFVRLERRADWRRLSQRLKEQDPDVLIVNTFQNPGPVAWASNWNGRMLGLVHNTELLRNTPLASEMIAAGRIGLLTLAPHVTANLMAIDPVLYGGAASITWTFPTPPRARPVKSEWRTIAVPGSVNFDSRDYQQILDALPGVLGKIDSAGFRIAIVGGGADRPALEKKVAEAGFSDQFQFVDLNPEGFVPSGAYYGHLRGADFTLPLVPTASPAFRTQKITSAIPATIGMGVPPILDRWTATVYDVPAVTYAAPAIGDGLVRALSMSDDEVAALRAELAQHKERELARSAGELAWALTSIGLRP